MRFWSGGSMKRFDQDYSDEKSLIAAKSNDLYATAVA
jgi:hypothetical protein